MVYFCFLRRLCDTRLLLIQIIQLTQKVRNTIALIFLQINTSSKILPLSCNIYGRLRGYKKNVGFVASSGFDHGRS